MSSTFNGNIQISIFGESHNRAVGVVMDSIPAGEKIDFEEILKQMQRRAPGKSDVSTSRKETDYPEIQSGVLNGYTTGSPICAIIKNQDQISQDYEKIKDIPRPGHADFTAMIKYKGFNDVRGGGHFSGRVTAGLTFAGAVCRQILKRRGIDIVGHISSIGEVEDDSFNYLSIDEGLISRLNDSSFAVINEEKMLDMKNLIRKIKLEKDSIGGTVECAVQGLPEGLGSPIFGKVQSVISSLIFSIGSIKAIEFGSGFSVAKLKGSQNNDEFILDGQKVITKTNNHGGILGGITTSMPLIFKVAVKPTPSIGIQQNSVNVRNKTIEKLQLTGRHDPCIVPRIVPVIESVTAIAILDLMMGAKNGLS